MKNYLKKVTVIGSVFLVAALIVSYGCAAPAKEKLTPAEFYKGKTIQFFVGANPGGGFDIVARALVPYIEKHTGATVVIVNRPGGGQLIVTNLVYTKGSREGTDILLGSTQYRQAQVVGTTGMQFEAAKFIPICSAAQYVYLMTTSPKLPTTFAEFRKVKGLKFGCNTPEGTHYLVPEVIQKGGLGMDVTCIFGYDTVPGRIVAIGRGELQAQWGSDIAAESFVKDGMVYPMAVFTPERLPYMPNVPTLKELVYNELSGEYKETFDWLTSQNEMNRTILAPPGVPQDRVDFLREVMKKVFEEPELKALNDRAKLSLKYYSSEELAKNLEKELNPSPKVKEIIMKSGGG